MMRPFLFSLLYFFLLLHCFVAHASDNYDPTAVHQRGKQKINGSLTVNGPLETNGTLKANSIDLRESKFGDIEAKHVGTNYLYTDIAYVIEDLSARDIDVYEGLTAKNIKTQETESGKIKTLLIEPISCPDDKICFSMNFTDFQAKFRGMCIESFILNNLLNSECTTDSLLVLNKTYDVDDQTINAEDCLKTLDGWFDSNTKSTIENAEIKNFKLTSGTIDGRIDGDNNLYFYVNNSARHYIKFFQTFNAQIDQSLTFKNVTLPTCNSTNVNKLFYNNSPFGGGLYFCFYNGSKYEYKKIRLDTIKNAYPGEYCNDSSNCDSGLTCVNKKCTESATGG